MALPAAPAVQEPTERDMKAMAYVLIQKRITQILEAKYPNVRWIWENSRAQEDIFIGNPVYVILNRAGGYKRGLVLIRNLQVFDVIFDAAPQTDSPAPPPSAEPPKQEPKTTETEEDDDIPEDFGLLAFQWVEAHIMELNERINEAIGKIQNELEEQVAKFEREGKLLEAQRIRMRTENDIEMLRETGFCFGIENYSMHIGGRTPEQRPYSLQPSPP